MEASLKQLCLKRNLKAFKALDKWIIEGEGEREEDIIMVVRIAIGCIS